MSNVWDETEEQLLAKLAQVRLRIEEWFADIMQSYSVDDRSGEKLPEPVWLYRQEDRLIAKLQALYYPEAARSRIRSVIPLDY